MSGLIYSNTSLANINNLLEQQEEGFKKQDKEQDTKKIVRYGVLLGITVVAIVLLKLVVKKKK